VDGSLAIWEFLSVRRSYKKGIEDDGANGYEVGVLEEDLALAH